MRFPVTLLILAVAAGAFWFALRAGPGPAAPRETDPLRAGGELTPATEAGTRSLPDLAPPERTQDSPSAAATPLAVAVSPGVTRSAIDVADARRARIEGIVTVDGEPPGREGRVLVRRWLDHMERSEFVGWVDVRKDGQFTAHVPPDQATGTQELELRYAADGAMSEEVYLEVSGIQPTQVSIEARSYDGATLTGLVLGRGERPAVRATVTVHIGVGNDAWTDEVTTDSAGRFVVQIDRHAPFLCTASHPEEGVEATPLFPRATGALMEIPPIQLRPLGIVEGVVMTRGGHPCPRRVVYATAPEGDHSDATVVTDEQGRFRMALLTAPEMELQVEGDPKTEEEPLVVPVDSIGVRLEIGSETLVARIFGPDGAPWTRGIEPTVTVIRGGRRTEADVSRSPFTAPGTVEWLVNEGGPLRVAVTDFRDGVQHEASVDTGRFGPYRVDLHLEPMESRRISFEGTVAADVPKRKSLSAHFIDPKTGLVIARPRTRSKWVTLPSRRYVVIVRSDAPDRSHAWRAEPPIEVTDGTSTIRVNVTSSGARVSVE